MYLEWPEGPILLFGTFSPPPHHGPDAHFAKIPQNIMEINISGIYLFLSLNVTFTNESDKYLSVVVKLK